jgi:hypothetical protein
VPEHRRAGSRSKSRSRSRSGGRKRPRVQPEDDDSIEMASLDEIKRQIREVEEHLAREKRET